MKEEKLSEDMEMLLRQLVCNGSVPMAGRALQLYACRCLKLDRKSADAFVLQYFEDTFPKELKYHRNKQKRQKSSSSSNGRAVFLMFIELKGGDKHAKTRRAGPKQIVRPTNRVAEICSRGINRRN